MKAELKARAKEACKRFDWWMKQKAITNTDKLVIALELCGVTKNLSAALRETEEQLGLTKIALDHKTTLLASCETALNDTEARLQVAVEALEAYAGDGALWFRNGDEDGVAHHICTDARKALAKIKEMEGSDE